MEITKQSQVILYEISDASEDVGVKLLRSVVECGKINFVFSRYQVDQIESYGLVL